MYWSKRTRKYFYEEFLFEVKQKKKEINSQNLTKQLTY